MSDSNYPHGVSSRHFDEDLRPMRLRIDDVLDREYLTVDGVEYDTHATLEFRKRGDTIEIADCNYRTWYVIVYPTGGSPLSLELDWKNLRTSFKQRLEFELDQVGLKRARESAAWQPLENERED